MHSVCIAHIHEGIKIHNSSGRNNGQKLVGHFLKIEHFCKLSIAIPLKMYSKFGRSAKCRNWSENGQWPTIISNTAIPYTMKLKCAYLHAVYLNLYD